MIPFDILISIQIFALGQALPPWVAPFFATYLIWLMVSAVVVLALYFFPVRPAAERMLRSGLGALADLGIDSIVSCA